MTIRRASTLSRKARRLRRSASDARREIFEAAERWRSARAGARTPFVFRGELKRASEGGELATPVIVDSAAAADLATALERELGLAGAEGYQLQ